MLQPSSSHIIQVPQQSAGNLQYTTSGGNFVPVFIGASPAGSAGIKQEPGAGLVQFQPGLQSLAPQVGGARVYLAATGAPQDNAQLHAIRMTNGTASMAPVGNNLANLTASTSGSHPTKGRSGGRRPNKDNSLTPEEDERRRIRRERNKQAAARCRKRRMDHTNVLVEETEQLEEMQSNLKADIENLQREKEEMEYLLQAHRVICSKDLHPHLAPNSPQTLTAPSDNLVSISDVQVMPPPVNVSVNAVPAANLPSVVVTTVEGSRPAKRNLDGTTKGAMRPSSLPVKNAVAAEHSLGLADPTPSPSKMVFTFDHHSGLTPTATGLTPTGLTPLIPSLPDGDQGKNPSRAPDAAAESTSPNTLVAL